MARQKQHKEGWKLQQPHEIIDSLKVQRSDSKAAKKTRVSEPEPKTIQKWEPPVNGWVIINLDDAVSKLGTNDGGGVVFRDHNALFLPGVSHLFPDIVDPIVIEALACRRALQVAVGPNIQRAHLELDSMALVVKINHP
ncbi:WD repeat domain phosphoinositide-interacting protein 3 [Hordeum vulgare]|nr:WD repeat domain phosphoinositide-interacting protein 3 [Hordeum vulgare]